MINIWVVCAHRFRHIGDVKLDRPTATRLQVCEQQPGLRPEYIARVWLAVEQLLGGAALTDRPRHLSQRSAQQLAVRIPKIRGLGTVIDQPLRLRDAIREVGRHAIDLPHTRVQPLKRLRIRGWRDVTVGHRLVVGPQGDGEAVTHVDARRHPRIERRDGARGCSEPTSDLNFERGACLVLHERDPRENVTRPQAEREPVRVMEHDGVIDPQTKR
ncbi:MAG TPA: hypothetical protein VMU89_17150 [Thermomicrobiaceae bacterium]|nr:hypothetical protein [Thermomicrobiaceae bacterium]